MDEKGNGMERVDIEHKKKVRGRVSKVILRFALVIMFLCVIGVTVYFAFLFYRNKYGTFESYDVITSIEKIEGNSSKYYSYNELLLKYSRDGAMTIDSAGEYLWNGSYEMNDPVIDVCGDYVAVADRGSKLVHIFNESGMVNSITVEHSILSVQVANQGVISVMMEDGNAVYVTMYKPDGKVISDNNKDVTSTGFPLSMDLSNDGQKVIVSYFDVLSGSLKTNIACYNFDDVGKNESNNFVGGNIYNDEVVANVKFITNDLVCFFNDRGFELYSMPRKLAETPIVTVDFETDIQSIFYSSSYVGFVLDTAEENYKYKVVVYNTKGKKVLEKGMNFDYTDVNMNDSDIIFYNYTECMVMSVDGTIRFQYKFDQSIDALYGISKNQFYVVYANRVEVIQMRGAR